MKDGKIRCNASKPMQDTTLSDFYRASDLSLEVLEKHTRSLDLSDNRSWVLELSPLKVLGFN